jgi:hypothetical protein
MRNSVALLPDSFSRTQTMQGVAGRGAAKFDLKRSLAAAAVANQLTKRKADERFLRPSQSQVNATPLHTLPEP